MKLYCGKCLTCNEWFVLEELTLMWQDSPNVFRGTCFLCYEDLEQKARELVWE